MPTRKVHVLVDLPEYTQAEETELALALLGHPASLLPIIVNTTLNKERSWNGTIFVNSPEVSPSILPVVSATANGVVPSPGAPLGRVFKDDFSWQLLVGGGDMLAANNLSDLLNAGIARTNLGVATTANQTDSSNKRFVSDAQRAKVDFITVTQNVDLDAIESRVNELDASVILKGLWDASSGTFPGAGVAQAGWSYIVSVAGTVNGIPFGVNDRIIAITDNASTTTYASNWHKADYTDEVLSVNGLTGAVTLTTNNVADFSNKRYCTDAEKTVIGNTSGVNSGNQIISDATITTTDIATNDVSTSKHGFFPKLPGALGKFIKDDLTYSYRAQYNQSVAAQGPGFATDTYLTGSSILIPASALKAGTRYKCVFNVVKTAAGVATPIINIRFGTNGSTADTSRGTLTFSAQTAVIDEGAYELYVTFRTVGSGTAAVIQSLGKLNHRLSITGLGVGVGEPEIATSGGFDSTVANSIIGLSVNGGASAAWTVNLVQATLENLN